MLKKYYYSKPSHRSKTRHSQAKPNDQPGKFEFKYHGNYCGPNYCGGRYHSEYSECDYSVAPIDKLDEICQQHDYNYEKVQNYSAADDLAAKQSWGIGGLRGFILSTYFRSGINRLVYRDRSTNPVHAAVNFHSSTYRSGMSANKGPYSMSLNRLKESNSLAATLNKKLLGDKGVPTSAQYYLYTSGSGNSAAANDYHAPNPNLLGFNQMVSSAHTTGNSSDWNEQQRLEDTSWYSTYSVFQWISSTGMHAPINPSAPNPKVIQTVWSGGLYGHLSIALGFNTGKRLPLLDGGVYNLDLNIIGYPTVKDLPNMLAYIGASDNNGTGNLRSRGTQVRLVSAFAIFDASSTDGTTVSGLPFTQAVWADIRIFDWQNPQVDTSSQYRIGSYSHNCQTKMLNPNSTLVHALWLDDTMVLPASNTDGISTVFADDAVGNYMSLVSLPTFHQNAGFRLMPLDAAANGILDITKITDISN